MLCECLCIHHPIHRIPHHRPCADGSCSFNGKDNGKVWHGRVVCSSSSHVLGGHREMALTSMCMLPHGWGHEAKSLTSINMLPHCKKPGVVDPGPEAVKESPPWRAMRPRTRRLQRGGLSAAGSDMLLPSLAKVCEKNVWRPNPPNRGAETARREVAPIVQRQKAKQ